MLQDKMVLTATRVTGLTISVSVESADDGDPVTHASYALALGYDNGRVLRWVGPAMDLLDQVDAKALLILAQAIHLELTERLRSNGQ